MSIESRVEGLTAFPEQFPKRPEKKRVPIKRAGRVNPYTLPTKENFRQQEQAKSEQFGHRVEQWLADNLKVLPGVSDARLTSNIEDSEKKDIEIRFKGDAASFYIQTTTNPDKIREKINEVGRDTAVVYINRDDFEQIGKGTAKLKKSALRRVAKIIISKMPLQAREALWNVYGF